MTVDEIFYRFLNGTDNDKAEVREFIQRPENLHMMCSKEFLNAAIRNAPALGIPTSEHIEFEDEHYEETCPCCGQHTNNYA